MAYVAYPPSGNGAVAAASVPNFITIPFSGTSVSASWEPDKYSRFEVHLTKTSGTSTSIIATLLGLASGTYDSYVNYVGVPAATPYSPFPATWGAAMTAAGY